MPFDPKKIVLHKFSCFWAFHYVQLTPGWTYRITGREHIQDGKAYMLVANHQSLMDILIAFGIKKHFKWVSKRSLFAAPFIGWNMYMNNHVGLIRGRSKSIKKMFKDCGHHLQQGSSVFMFPEGTRSEDGEVKKFKNGAFKLAVENNVPVIPIIINGSKDGLAKDSMIFNFGHKVHISVDILPPLEPADFNSDSKLLQQKTHELIVEKLAEVRNQKS
jgi:1-acyl-sn-glycerol-3-phosphate acyltransferase